MITVTSNKHRRPERENIMGARVVDGNTERALDEKVMKTMRKCAENGRGGEKKRRWKTEGGRTRRGYRGGCHIQDDEN